MFRLKSKTFLLGEYTVLFGGSAIVLATDPEFQLIVNEAPGMSSLSGIDENSSAFSFYGKHLDIFRDMSLEFIDPHNGAGGFGASSAQFVSLYKQYLATTGETFCASRFLDEYRDLCNTNRVPGAISPSGADCLAQYFGHHIYYDSTSNHVEKMEWPFDDLCVTFFKTGIKIATHEHLSTFAKPKQNDLSQLNSYVVEAKCGLASKNLEMLCESVQGFYDLACQLGLVIESTQDIVRKLRKDTRVLAVKGCGALFADTILVVHYPTSSF